MVRDFGQLAGLANDAFEPGLADRPNQADLVLLAPCVCLDATYDEVTQEVTRDIGDAGGRMISLILRHSPETDHGLTTLQQIDGSSLKAVLGSMRIGARGLYVEPITLWTDTKPIHLTLDGATSMAVAVPPAPSVAEVVKNEAGEAEAPVEVDEDATQVTPPSASPIGLLFGCIERELLAIAESGVEVVRDLAPLRAIAKECAALGLATCCGELRCLSDELDRFRSSVNRDSAEPARQLLRAAYVVELARECATVYVSEQV